MAIAGHGGPAGRRSGSLRAVDATMHIAKGVVIVSGAGAILVSAAAALGFRSDSPKETLERMNHRVDSNVVRITSLERRLGDLENKQNFTNYLLCVQMRTTNPVMLPSDCAPIIQARTAP